MELPRVRTPATQRAHYELYLEHMARHEQLRAGFGTGDPHKLARLWANLRDELNDLNLIPSKSTAEWRIRFRNWRNTARFKARMVKLRDGNEPVRGPTKVCHDYFKRKKLFKKSIIFFYFSI